MALQPNGSTADASRHQQDQRLEAVIGQMLRAGVTIAALVMLAGGVMYLRHPGVPAPDYMHFHSAPVEALTIGKTFTGVAHGSSLAIIQLGILLLIATPVVRVVFALVGFLLEKDRLYTAVSVIVLAILLFSLIHSR
jgi:uncharacterized membrane protein